jgi:ribosomal protein S18 acetylase RimI-like enzyme
MGTIVDPYEAIHRLNVDARSAQVMPGWEGAIEDDVLYLTANVPIAPVNVVGSARFTARNADRRIDQVLVWFGGRGLPVAWWVCDRDAPPDLEARLEAKGFVREELTPGMVVDLADVPAEPAPTGVEIEWVRDEPTYAIASATMAAGFGAPAQLGDVFAAMAVLGFDEAAASRTYLARLDGVPVATSLGLLVEDVLGIFNVATLEHARRRGIGRAVTLAALVDGPARGARRAVLQSSEDGHHVYEALGFRDFGTYRMLVRQQDGRAHTP